MLMYLPLGSDMAWYRVCIGMIYMILENSVCWEGDIKKLWVILKKLTKQK